MIEMILTFAGMLLVTLLIRYLLFRFQKKTDFWKGTYVIYIGCVLGILSMDAGYFAAILGYIVGCDICKLTGWN